MTELNPPFALQNRTDHAALTVRGLADALTSTSAVVGTGDMKVSQRGAGANMSVDVAGGLAFIEGTESATQGAYVVRSDSTVVNLAIAAANATLPRIDLVVAKVQDAFYSGVTNAWSLAVVTGTAAASPVAPSVPNNSLTLAQISVGANVSTIVTANIADKRVIAAGRLYSGDLSVTSTTRPAVPWTGLTIFETDTKNQYLWDGTTWQLTGKVGAQPYAMAVGLASVTANGTAGPFTVSPTFPAGRFTQAPRVTATVDLSGGAIGGAYMSMQNASVTTSGFTLQALAASSVGNGTVVTIAWQAIQMTPTSADG